MKHKLTSIFYPNITVRTVSVVILAFKDILLLKDDTYIPLVQQKHAI